MHELSVVIKRPLTTERSIILKAQNKYVFRVAPWANKIQIKKAVEHFFGAKVKDVNTMVQHGKKRRRRYVVGQKPDWKKAIVTLKEGEKIELFENI
ncbi:TPA: 50S ribosomal protein L23 [bacterium]|nr:50S ribosomal protein L23 [bacterium]